MMDAGDRALLFLLFLSKGMPHSLYTLLTTFTPHMWNNFKSNFRLSKKKVFCCFFAGFFISLSSAFYFSYSQ